MPDPERQSIDKNSATMKKQAEEEEKKQPDDHLPPPSPMTRQTSELGQAAKKKKDEAAASQKKKGLEKSDLTEEDLALKDKLEKAVHQILDVDPETQDALNTPASEHATVTKSALDTMSKEIRTSTGSMTALPRPLKFLRPHYKALKQHYETTYSPEAAAPSSTLSSIVDKAKSIVSSQPSKSELQALYADTLSVISMTAQADADKTRETLKYKLQGDKSTKVEFWGHEYVRHLSGEIGKEYDHRQTSDADTSNLIALVDEIVPFFLGSNAEYDAVDLMIETEKIGEIVDKSASDNYDRIAKYILSCSSYIADNDDLKQLLTVAYETYMKHNAVADALRAAIKLGDKQRMYATFEATDDETLKKQLAFLLAHHRIVIDEIKDNGDELADIMGNVKLHDYFLQLAADLDVKEAKSPEDIYKSWLEEGGSTRRGAAALNRPAPTASSGVDSAKQNLASTFVNAFVNAGFGKDLLVLPEGSDWLHKNKSHGMLSATASVGLLMLWDVESGFSAVDKYSFSSTSFIKAGSALAHGILSSGVTSEMDAAQALLAEHIDSNDTDLKVSAILGLGIAYAGTAREDVLEMLVPKIVEEGATMEVVATTCLALGLVYCGTGNEDISGSIVEAFLDRSETDLKDSSARFMCLGIGLLFMGQAENAEGALEALKVIEHPISKYLQLTVETCAWTGTSSVLAIQKLLTIAAEALEEDEADPLKTSYQEVAVLGIAAVAMGEDLASEMALRALDHVLQYGEVVTKRVIPLALGLLSISNPRLTVLDTLSKLSHDQDQQVSQNAVLAMGFLGAGTNNSRIATVLRGLASYYAKEPNHLFLVRLAQGLLHTGKGLMTLSPVQSDGAYFNQVSMAGLLTVMHAALDLKNTLLAKRHYLLYTLAMTIRPRMLMTLDEELKPLPVSVRVGQRVDTVGVVGKPKTITGFQTHNTPVLLAAGERAELATDEYLPLSNLLEGFVILKKNPNYVV